MVLYGYKVTSADDQFMKLAEESTEVLSNKLVTGGGVWAVDIFPFRAFASRWKEWGFDFSHPQRCSEIHSVLVPWRRVQTICR